MKIFKRIIYSLLGLLLTGVVVLVGFILYAEFSGRPVSPIPNDVLVRAELANGESRLAYDENGNLMELPEGVPANAAYAEEASEEDRSQEGPDTSDSQPADSSSADAISADTSSADASADSASQAATGSSYDIKYHYIMDLGSNLFHYETCDYAANIADENHSEMTTTRDKIINAGFEACPNCSP